MERVEVITVAKGNLLDADVDALDTGQLSVTRYVINLPIKTHWPRSRW